MKVCVTTIVAANYLAYAKVLADSIKKHIPTADFQVVVADEVSEEHSQWWAVARELGVKFAYELGLDDFEKLSYKFDLVEFNTAIKPTVLKRLLDDGYDRVMYLDPDIRVFSPLDAVFNTMEYASVVLTPHALTGVMDGFRPSDVDFLRNGVFNLGFVAVANTENARSMLDWWEERCLSWGFNDPTFGIFVDQKWMNLAPCYFEEVAILKHPGCNVAYWNLHERALEISDESKILVNQKRLEFFHFSGVDASESRKLSKHQSRHKLDQGGVLAAMVEDYCKALLDAGHSVFRSIPYAYGSLSDGAALNTAMRRSIEFDIDLEGSPFSADSLFQRRLRKAGLSNGQPISLGKSTLDFDQAGFYFRVLNTFVRIILKILGVGKLSQLLRYASVLLQGSNLPAVALGQPLRLEHEKRR